MTAVACEQTQLLIQQTNNLGITTRQFQTSCDLHHLISCQLSKTIDIIDYVTTLLSMAKLEALEMMLTN